MVFNIKLIDDPRLLSKGNGNDIRNTPKANEYFVLSYPLTMISLKSKVIGEFANKSVEVNVRIKRP